MLDLRRLPIDRQHAVGDALKEQLDPKKHKSLDKDVLELGRAVVALTEPLKPVVAMPKLVVDSASDAVIGGVFKILGATVQALTDRVVPLDETQRAHLAAAQLILQRAFPEGVDFTRIDMSLQLPAMRALVSALESEPVAAAVATLGLQPYVKHIKSHLAPYGHCLKAPDGSALDAASDQWHEAFEAFGFAVKARYRGDKATQSALLGAYQQQLEAWQSDQRAARKKTLAQKSEGEK